MKNSKLLLSFTLTLITACTPQAIPSGIQTSSPVNLTEPVSQEEAQLVDNELATQRSTRRAGHGFTYQADPGRLRCHYCHGYYYHRYYW